MTAFDPGRESREALALLMAGQEEAGLARYGQCLKGDRAEHVPVGLHLLFLERAGRAATADALRRMAVRRGGDIALKGLPGEASPEAIVAEYDALFARGQVNARMVQAQLSLLTRLGQHARVAVMLDVPRRLRIVQLDLPGYGGDSAGLAPQAQAALLRLEHESCFRETDQSVRQMHMIDDIERVEDPALQALLEAFRAESAAYLADWAADDHPLARQVPQRFQLHGWGLVSRGDGFNVPHFHHRGWATGVYYPVGLGSTGPGGELRIGPPAALGETALGWTSLTIRPEPGMLVLMPSFYLHWTVPLGRPGLRTSIAFDMLPEN